MTLTLREAFNYPHVVPAGSPRDFANAYRWHREHGKPASAAIVCARKDVAEGTARYPHGGPRPGNPDPVYRPIGPAFQVGSTSCRWFESPEDHFRLVGFADEGENAAVSHNGWYVDPSDQGEVARGVVYRLNHGRGFVYGVADPWNNGPAVLNTDDPIIVISEGSTDAAEVAANNAADHVAKRYAEDEREYRAASHARSQHDELGEQVKEWRKAALALFREIREIRRTLCGHPNVIGALRDKVESLVEKISEARRERAELAAGFDREAGWQDA